MKKIINFILGIAIIFIIEYLSIWILKLLKISLPHPILGILILFTLLQMKIIKEEWVEDFCNFITKYMILFFIPIFTGIITYQDLIKKNLFVIIGVIFITGALIIIFTSLLTENIIKFKRLLSIKRKAKQ